MTKKHNITLPVSGYSGTVEVGTAQVTIEMPVGKLEGTLTHYALELSNQAGQKIKLELSKDPKGNWYEMFMFKLNDSYLTKEIEEAKQEIDSQGI